MHFQKVKGRQVLDLRGSLVLTYKKRLIEGTSKSALPFSVVNAKFAQDLGQLSLARKLRVLFMVARFIFSRKYAMRYESEKPQP